MLAICAMQSSHNEPSERDLWFYHGKQHRQDSLPRCASSPVLSNLFPAHVWQSARYTLPHSLCNRPGPILQNDKVSIKVPDPVLPAASPPRPLPLPLGSVGGLPHLAAMFASLAPPTPDGQSMADSDCIAGMLNVHSL